MNILGSVGQLYVFVLLALLFIGSGLALWGFIDFLMARKEVKNIQPGKLKVEVKDKNNEKISGMSKIIGGQIIMANNGWVKLAVLSVVGIVVSVAILGFVSTSNPQAAYMNQNQYQQGIGQQNGMTNINTQGYSNGNMNMNGGSSQDPYAAIQQQLSQLQQQLNQMQQAGGNYGNNQMQNMQQQNSGNMNNMQQNSNNGNMNNMPQNNGNMNNMPQNNSNMNNMPQSSGSSSSAMPMM